LTSVISGTARLRSLDLQGYKTFAFKTEIELAPTITVVVGPNGSGKSNIADAIRWVLGEQSYSLLRGKKTEDMIFSGSESKPRAGMAAATIGFDNSDGWLPIDFSEVNITRRAYRDGQNEYLINGQRVRLRDVTELLASSGLGQRAYTIIGQGLVDAALSLRAEERRRLFEEAAGIGLYRSRREEALRRLDSTRRNLERVQDILTELQPRLRSLKRQAKRADEYEQVKHDLNSALRIWYGYHWYHLLDRVTEVTMEAEEKTNDRDELRSQQENIERDLGTSRNQIDTYRSQIRVWTQQVSEMYSEREVMGRNLAVTQERLRWLAEQDGLIRAEIDTLGQTRDRLQESITSAAEEEKIRQKTLEAALEDLQSLESGAVERVSLHAHLGRAETARKELERLAADQAAWRTRCEQIEEQLAKLSTQRDELEANRHLQEQRVEEIKKQIEVVSQEHHDVEENHKKASKVCSDIQQKLAEVENTHDRMRQRISNLEMQQARLEALQEVKRTTQETRKELADLLQRGEREGSSPGFVGEFTQHLHVTAEYQGAIRAALGEFRQSFTFKTVGDLLKTLAWLSEKGKGSGAAFLPLRSQSSLEILEVPSQPGCEGNAASLVDVDENVRPAIDLLLGQTIVVRDVDTAQRILPDLPSQARVVTLQGDLFFQNGAVLLARDADGDDPEAIKRLESQYVDLCSDLEEARSEEKQLVEEQLAAQQELGQAQTEVEQVRNDLLQARLACEQTQMHLQDAEERHSNLQGQIEALESTLAAVKDEKQTLAAQGDSFDAQHAELEQALNSAVGAAESADPNVGMAKAQARLELARSSLAEVQSRRGEGEKRLADREEQYQEWKNRLANNESERNIAQQEAAEVEGSMDNLDGRLTELREKIAPMEQSMQDAERKRNEMEAEGNRLRSALQAAERANSQAQIDLARRQEELASLRRRVEDDFGLVAFEYGPGEIGQEPLPLEGLVERLQRVDELPEELESQVNHLRAQIRRMGSVNPEAQREFVEVSERMEFMTSQLKDLRKAEERIHEVIAELNVLMEREFRKTFDAVSTAFKETYKRLFGGGSARLILTDPEDLTQTGIDIEARLPGRREQGLAVLSGGERSLVATSLIFSLLKVSPTPFCVLDEVDAMLDESNVMRFNDMLRELSDETQFVVITHNRLTAQSGEVIYGVSMGADSVSRVLSLKLEDVEKELAT
jgi:chromosome segregation protein